MATRLEFYPNREAGEDEQKAKDVQFEHGYRLGFVDSNKVRRCVSAAVPSGSTLHSSRSLERRSWLVPDWFLDGSWLVAVWFLTGSCLVPVFVLSQFYLHNHLSFILYFHKEELEEGGVHSYRVVRFEVVPQSVKVEGR